MSKTKKQYYILDGIFYADNQTIRTAISSYKKGNQDKLPHISEWNTSKVTNMKELFNDFTSFNVDISKWDVSSVDDMSEMFSGCKQFNQPLNNWDVSNVKEMGAMFEYCETFNQPLNNWDVSNVENMDDMFSNCKVFNQPLKNWDVSNVKYMNNTFFACKAFNQNLSRWKLSPSVDIHDMFYEATSMNASYKPIKPIEPKSVKNPTNNSNLNSTSTSNVLSPIIYKSYKDMYYDEVHDKFAKLMFPFEANPETIIGKPLYINDKILYNQTNPYVVHYETINGGVYPIVTILKGTMLFTGRANISTNLTDSYFYLYKLNDSPTLAKYSKLDYAKALTYFFPFPYLSNVISSDHKTLDMVVLTKDIRLLCLISPSPLERGFKDMNNQMLYNDFEGKDSTGSHNRMINSCLDRKYDLCIDQKLVSDLKLNGYIGIAYQDSFTTHLGYPSLNEIFNTLPNSFDLLLQACCFNNAVYPEKFSSNTFLKEILNSRTIGIPEIVLIPYDIHTYPDAQEYANIYNSFRTTKTNNIDHSHFIFRHECHVDGKNSIDLAKKMEEKLIAEYPLGNVIGKSLQAPPLITVLLSDVESDKQDYVKHDTQFTFEEVNFINSYLNPPISKCAFELKIFYDMLEQTNISGGKKRRQTKRKHTVYKKQKMGKRKYTRKIKRGGEFMQLQQNVVPNTYLHQNVNVNRKRKAETEYILPTKQIRVTSKRVETPNLYYNEVNGMPIVAYIKNK